MGLSDIQEGINRPSDSELVAAVLDEKKSANRPDAAGELFGRYHGRIYAFCLRYLGSRDMALDVSQDTLLAAWEKLDTFGGRSQFSSWLFSIARNRCLNLIRSDSRIDRDDDALEGMSDGAVLPDRELMEKEGEEGLLALIKDCLDPVEQKALWLRCFEKVPVDEITRLLDIGSASGARALLQKARRKLRAAMDGR